VLITKTIKNPVRKSGSKSSTLPGHSLKYKGIAQVLSKRLPA
jgi:hypothetical protein